MYQSKLRTTIKFIYRIDYCLLTLNDYKGMSSRNLPGGKGRPGNIADNFTAICEPTA
jgi:hypothetical protein